MRMRLRDPLVVEMEVESASFDLTQAVLSEMRSIPEVTQYTTPSGELIRSERLATDLTRLRYAEGLRQIADRMSDDVHVRLEAENIVADVGPVSALCALVSAARIVAQGAADRQVFATLASALAGSPNPSVERVAFAAVSAAADAMSEVEDYQAVVTSMATLVRYFDGVTLVELRSSVAAAFDALAKVYAFGAGDDAGRWAEQLYSLADAAVATR